MLRCRGQDRKDLPNQLAEYPPIYQATFPRSSLTVFLLAQTRPIFDFHDSVLPGTFLKGLLHRPRRTKIRGPSRRRGGDSYSVIYYDTVGIGAWGRRRVRHPRLRLGFRDGFRACRSPIQRRCIDELCYDDLILCVRVY